MRVSIVLFLSFVLSVTACKTIDFSVVDSSYQQWYDGRGTTSGVNFYLSIEAQKKLKNIKFTQVKVNNHNLNPIVILGKKRINEIPLLNKSDTVRVSAPLVLKGKKSQITDTTTVILSYERKGKPYQITITRLVQKQKLFYH